MCFMSVNSPPPTCTRLPVMSTRRSCFPPCVRSACRLARLILLISSCPTVKSCLHVFFFSTFLLLNHIFPENHSCGVAINIINVEGKTETEEGGTGAQSRFLCVGKNTGRKRLLPGSRTNLGQNFLGLSLTSEAQTCLPNGLQHRCQTGQIWPAG